MASAWITILTVTCGGVTVKPFVSCFLFASRTVTVNGRVKPGAWRPPRSISTAAWMPVSWLLGPSTCTVAGVTVVAFACSWKPVGSAVPRWITTVWFELASSSIVTCTELGATTKKIASSLSRRLLSRIVILSGPILPSPYRQRWPVQLGARLEKRSQHLPEPVRVEIAQELALMRHGDLAELLAQDQDDGIGL